MATTNSYHATNLGKFSRYVRPDINGYVHLSADAIMDGEWDAAIDMDEEWAEEIARENREGTDAANAAIARWQRQN